MFLPSWNESDPVSLDSFLVFFGFSSMFAQGLISAFRHCYWFERKSYVVKHSHTCVLPWTYLSYPLKKYMLFAGWKVRIVKNCALGLENTARGHSFSPYGPTLSRWITYLFFLNLTKFFPREPELWLWFKRLPNKLWNIMFASICHDLTTVN